MNLPAQQLLLDLGPAAQPATLDNFVVGNNRELLSRLRAFADPGVFDQIYLWGPAGSGRSHLLAGARALAEERGRPIVFAHGHEIGTELSTPPGSLVIIDGVETLTADGQITLFRIFNAARLVGLALLLSGSAPPLALENILREDLRTRLGAALIYEVHPLDDAAKATALRQHAHQRGIRLDEAVIDYLLHHGQRHLPALLATLDHADRVSLEKKRSLPLPLLREVMHNREAATAQPDTGSPHESGTV